MGGFFGPVAVRAKRARKQDAVDGFLESISLSVASRFARRASELRSRGFIGTS